MDESLGLVEVRGLASAVNVADAMLKAANVRLLGMQKAKGRGWMTVEVAGDVGSVQAAVQAGQASAAETGALVGTKVIPRPATGIEDVLAAPGCFGSSPEVGERPEPSSNQAVMAEPAAVSPPGAGQPAGSPESGKQKNPPDSPGSGKLKNPPDSPGSEKPKSPADGTSAEKPGTPPRKRGT